MGVLGFVYRSPAAFEPLAPLLIAGLGASADDVSRQARSVSAASTPPTVRQGGAEGRFLHRDEVDQPASPADDWVVDLTRLPPGLEVLVTVAVWTDQTGRIVRYEVLQSEPALPLVTLMLGRFAETRMRAAYRLGRPVPAVTHFQLALSR